MVNSESFTPRDVYDSGGLGEIRRLVPALGVPGLATTTDPALKNPWGVSHGPTSPFWVSNQGTSTATLYGVTDETNVVKVRAVNPPTGTRLSKRRATRYSDRRNGPGTPPARATTCKTDPF